MLSVMSGLVRRVFLFIVISVLGGCASPPIVEQKITGKEGAVVIKLIVAEEKGWNPAETLSSILLKREPSSNATEAASGGVLLVRVNSELRRTAFFGGTVVPGRYRIAKAFGQSGKTQYTFPLDSQLNSSFDVKEGEASLLGTIVIQTLDEPRFNVGYVPPDAEFAEMFDQLFPTFAEQTRGKQVHSFELTTEMNRRYGLATKFKYLIAARNGLSITDKGAVFAGGEMGNVLWRKAGEKRWRELNVGSWKEVLSVRAYRNGLLAAGEGGLLRYSSDEGKTWFALTPPDKSLIVAAEPLQNGRVIVLTRRQSEWTAYISDDLLSGVWRTLGSFSEERSFNVQGKTGVVVHTGNRVGVMMPNGAFHVADGDTGMIERYSTGLSMLSVEAMPDGMLVMQGVVLLRTTLVSTDGGKTWTDLNTNRFVTAITFADANKAYAVAPIDPGAYPGAYGLMVSSDRGRTWAQSGSTPGGTPLDVLNLFVDRTDGSLLALLRDSRIMRSTNEGKTWTQDR